MTSTPDRTESLFAAAVALPTDERADYLHQACAGDTALREHVDALLRAHERAAHLLDRPFPVGMAKTGIYVPDAQPGTVIAGRYKLLEAIGEGGMGTVWVAEQIEPVRRKVALKLIKAGMDSRSVLARFESERQALALMDHPCVAKILDGGMTESGRPYFVMEYVKGVPITEYCDATRLSVPERLQLFAQVCEAVQHAHQKGIIHRDLKPSNILVAPYDDKAVPKIIDFGLAKAMHQSLTDKTLHTAHDSVLGTPLYMSPEQAQLNNLDVDTRSDIYSLGVLLYELLTGTTPLEKARFKEVAWDEIRRLIRDEEPPRPSARLTSTNTLPSLAACRQTQPLKLTKQVRGELDWIVMKALDKDRARRYETANALAKDVQRFLSGDSVEACPPRLGYRLRKFAHKNRSLLFTAGAFGGLLLAAVIVSGSLAIQARRAEAIAKEKRLEADANAREARRNAAMYHGMSMANRLHAEEARTHAASLQIDLDLAELETDRRLGLLRLLRTLKSVPDNQLFAGQEKELKEFINLVIVAIGQTYASLLPPISHDGQGVATQAFSADNQTLLTLGKDYTARLWDTRTAKPIAVLQQGNERVVNCGFSPDGRTIFTDDLTSVARLWDVPSGRFRAATEARPNRYDEKFTPVDLGSSVWTYNSPQNSVQIGNGRLLTRRFDGGSETGVGPVELWDTTSGRLVVGLNGPDRDVQRFKFLTDFRWITTLEGNSTVVVFSADDGRLVSRLGHPAGETVHDIACSPSGKRIATASRDATGQPLIRMWDTKTWQPDSAAVPIDMADSLIGLGNFQFWTEDLFAFSGTVEVVGQVWGIFRRGQVQPVQWMVASRVFPAVDNLVRLGDGTVLDSGTWKRLFPPAGRKFSPDLARFASDGRFVTTYPGGLLIDTLTDKHVGPFSDEGWINHPGWASTTSFGNLPGFGLVGLLNQSERVSIHFVPSITRLQLPAEILELWAQVVVRGELGADGQLVNWDEPRWDQKRRELAAKPAPYPDFPFPGQIATDGLYWLRQEYQNAKDGDKSALAQKLFTRAEEAGNKTEMIHWQNVLKAGAKPPTK